MSQGSGSDAHTAASVFEPDLDPPEILDACCGGRQWWWEKDHPLAVYMDVRTEPKGSCDVRPNWSCEPGLVGDFRAMPFEDESFQLVLFDPPHIVRKNAGGYIGLKFGALPPETEQDDLARGFAECWRVLRPGGTLVFKWADKLERVQSHFPATPIVGTRSPRGGQTRWFIFYKPLDPDYAPAFQDEYQRLWHREAELRRCNVQMPGGDGNQLCDLWPDHEGPHMNAAESSEWGGKPLRFSRG